MNVRLPHLCDQAGSVTDLQGVDMSEPSNQTPLDDPQIAHWARLRQIAREAEAEFAVALVPVTDPVAVAVLELHKDENGRCAAEQDDNYVVWWPCQTVLTVASALGMAIPAHLA
jgi:hypothetical protein